MIYEKKLTCPKHPHKKQDTPPLPLKRLTIQTLKKPETFSKYYKYIIINIFGDIIITVDT